MKLRIGTRGSMLARAQAADVALRLEGLGHETETVVISTAGDRQTDRAFADVGAFGIFVREIEAALLDGRVDVAVHSYKDLPSRSPAGLVIAAVPERVDVADLLLARPHAVDAGGGALPLCRGARVGTSAARRQALLRQLRPDLDVGQLRGNVPTRVRSLAEGRFDAVVLAAAGVARLELVMDAMSPLVPADVVRTRLDPDVFVPAPAQGAIAVQVRADAPAVREAVARIDDPRTSRALRAERAVLALAEGGCTLPFGAWCRERADGMLHLVSVLGREDGTVARTEVTGDDPEAVAAAGWRALSATVMRGEGVA
ncbi:MAG: hydroxymethylbilane synthase [Gemmatimonadales bacterium]